MAGYKGCIENIHICGISAAVPSRTVDNIAFAEMMGDKRNRRQLALTGIRTRHICDVGQSASDFATFAAENLLMRLGWNRDEIKHLIFVTQFPDLARPSTAMLIQKRLGIGTDCSCFDVNLGCSGFVVGLQVMASMLSTIGGKGLLVVGDGRYEESDEIFSPTDLLFGHGGAATAIEIAPGYPMLYKQKTDGNRFDMIMCRRNGKKQMDGLGVMQFTLNELTETIRDFRDENHLCEENIDFYAFHQPQKVILEGIASECSIPWEKLLNSFEKYGNTRSASVPISICANEKRLKEKDKVRLLMSGFGIGMSWGIDYLTLDTENIMPVMETDCCYPEKAEHNL